MQPKICFFSWEAIWRKILTLDQFESKGIPFANKCYFCLEQEKSLDHFLIHCIKTRSLWELLFSLFGVTWVNPLSLRDTLLSWKGFRVVKKQEIVWQASPFCLFWTVWKARNVVAFNDEVFSTQRLKISFVYLLWSETKLSLVDGPLTLVGFIDGWVVSEDGVSFCTSQLFLWGLFCNFKVAIVALF